MVICPRCKLQTLTQDHKVVRRPREPTVLYYRASCGPCRLVFGPIRMLVTADTAPDLAVYPHVPEDDEDEESAFTRLLLAAMFRVACGLPAVALGQGLAATRPRCAP